MQQQRCKKCGVWWHTDEQKQLDLCWNCAIKEVVRLQEENRMMDNYGIELAAINTKLLGDNNKLRETLAAFGDAMEDED